MNWQQMVKQWAAIPTKEEKKKLMYEIISTNKNDIWAKLYKIG